MKKRRLWFLLLVMTVAVIAFLTFQNRNNTEALSNGIKDRLNNVGINISGKRLRSDAHIAEYCILGIVLSKYGFISNKTLGWVIIIGFCFGLIDEMVRFLIPTREFELIDLIKDWIGIILGTIIVFYSCRNKKEL